MLAINAIVLLSIMLLAWIGFETSKNVCGVGRGENA